MNGPRTVWRTALLAMAVVGVGACPKTPEPGDPLRGLTGAERARFEAGKVWFDTIFTAVTGVGPLFNAAGCIACHNSPARGGAGAISEVHASALQPNGFCDPLADKGGPVYQQLVTDALRQALGIDREPIPPEATDSGIRTTPDVFGFGLLDAIPDATILAFADPDDSDGDGISGRPNRFFDGRIGRFGRKAVVPTLLEFNEGAFLLEQGITTPNAPEENSVAGDPLPAGVDPAADPEISASDIGLADGFVRFSAPPAPRDLTTVGEQGRNIFERVGCAKCHVPTLRTGDHPVSALSNRDVSAYTDLLLHDMGPELADMCLGLDAQPAEFRTEPLMGLRHMNRFLHDGRATTIQGAIELHGGEADGSRALFEALTDAERTALLEFLRSL